MGGQQDDVKITTLMLAPADTVFGSDAIAGATFGRSLVLKGDNGTILGEAKVVEAHVRNGGHALHVTLDIPDDVATRLGLVADR